MSTGLTKEEVNRKLLHLIAVILPAGIFYGPELLGLERIWICSIIFGMLLTSLSIEFARFGNEAFGLFFGHCFGSMMRPEEGRQLTGATYVLAGSATCSLFSLHDELAAACAFLALTLFILGDAAAALVGKAIGRIRIGGKTLEGAMGCLLVCMALAAFAFPRIPGFLENWRGEYGWIQILVVSSTVTILELFPIKLGRMALNDNLYVPAFASVVVWLVS